MTTPQEVANIQNQIAEDISTPVGGNQGGKHQLQPFAWADGKGYVTQNKTIAEHHAANGEQMMELVARGCAYCNHPMYLGQKCKNCGREVAPPVVKTCETCAHFEHGKYQGVRVHDETCYECSEYYATKWEAENE